MKKILAIGCGGAGMFSLIVASQLKKGKFETTILSDEPDIYCRCTTPYILTNQALLQDAIQSDCMIEDYGVKVVHERATSIDTVKQQVSTNKGNQIDYDYLVIATGASPFLPKIQGIALENVHTVRTSKDVEEIQKSSKNAKSAIVIGAGVIGIEMAAVFKENGLDVCLIESAPDISPNIADKEYAEKIKAHLTKNEIKLLFSAHVLEIKENNLKQKEVIVKSKESTKTFLADLVVLATGVRPNLEIIKDTNIITNENGILVNEKMQTNIQNIYACGDCCLPKFSVTGEARPAQLASNAIQQAKIVGFQLAGFPIKYAGSTGAFAFQALSQEYAGAGLTEEIARKKFKWVITGKAETTNIYKDLKSHELLEVKLIFAGPRMRLVGYEAFGKGVIASAEVASLAIGLKLSMLKMLHFNYIAHPSLTPWPFMNPIIMATEDAMGNLMQKVKTFFKQ
jgi:NADH oxidase (H2O2-forming)